jgi:hypothetical protein
VEDAARMRRCVCQSFTRDVIAHTATASAVYIPPHKWEG